MAEQLKLLVKTEPHDRVGALLARVQALGWEPDPASRAGSGYGQRWHLPGTAWRLRAHFDTTTVYRLLDRSAVDTRMCRTANLTGCVLLLETIMLQEKMLCPSS